MFAKRGKMTTHSHATNLLINTIIETNVLTNRDRSLMNCKRSKQYTQLASISSEMVSIVSTTGMLVNSEVTSKP